jgi:hypothetical protein
VNDDQVDDFAVGNPWDDLGATDAGSVTLYSGLDRSILCRAGSVDSFENLGVSVAAVGDLDRDGIPDFAASSPAHDFIAVLSGADCTEIARCSDETVNPSGLGDEHGLARFVDVTGDGIPELLAGAHSTSTPLHHGGRAIVFTVSAGGACSVLRTLDDPALTIYAHLGWSIGGIDDVTGDGVPEIAVGEPGYSNYRGSVLVFSGADGALVRRIVDPSAAQNDHFGESLAPTGCLDGDGIGELVVGAPRRNVAGRSNAGRALLLSPEDGVVLHEVVDAEGGASEWLSWSIAVLPDIDGDGVEDLVAGARYADVAGASDSGKAVVFSGASGAKIADLIDAQGSAHDELGYSVACAGDLSGDGVPEILVGAPFDDRAVGLDEGSISIFALEPDCDGDGLGPFGGDCDDADLALWSVPGEAMHLVLRADRRTVGWDAPEETGGSSVVLAYDLVRAADPDRFAVGACIASDQQGLTAEDPAAPDLGSLFGYLARARNGCGEGTAGMDGEGEARIVRACP